MKTYKVTVEYGTTKWYDFESGKLHREDGPAVEWASGGKEWYRNGKLHREDGPACEYANGSKYWYRDGKYHREDGPAIEYASGGKEWYRDGKCHREDGPAIEYASGDKYWYLNDVHLTEQQWKDQTQSKQASSCEGKTVTIDGQTYKLTKI